MRAYTVSTKQNVILIEKYTMIQDQQAAIFSAVLTHGRALGVELLWAHRYPPPPLPLKGCMGPCFWLAPAIGGPLGFRLVSLIDNAALAMFHQ